MSPKVPSSLPKDIQIYITRSNELESPEPLMSYFCKLYAVEQILNLGLHTRDESISAFAMELLDSIETFKTNTRNSENVEIISDQETSIAYVLSFANSIFKNSLDQIVNQKSTRGTAISLLTSTQFFKLLNLWKNRYQELEETEQLSKKIKYAKFHASRILKALKNGEDPNDYTAPVNDSAASDLLEDANFISGFSDEHIPPSPSLKTDDLPSKDNSLGESEVDELGLPSAPKSIQSQESPKVPEIPQFIDEGAQTEEISSLSLPSTPQTIVEPPQQSPKIPEPEHRDIDINQIIETGDVYSKATKHSKFAISAMNYEDTKTAIKELETAIALLKTLKE